MARLRYGGQALVEGVMMRGRGAIAVALRAPDGRIVCQTEPLSGTFRATRWAKMPFVRGLVVLYETLVVGTRWLVRSANLAASEEGVELGSGGVALMLGITLTIGIAIFFFLPLLITRAVVPGNGGILEHVVEGVVQVSIFIGYLLLISRAGDVKRTFMYHGAEHMSIHALENGDPLTVDRVRPYPTAHPRCGTEFLVVVIILSILTFSLIGRQPIPVTIVSRIMTKRPTDDQIEVAIVSLQEALTADGQQVPEGSAEIARTPYAEFLAAQAVDQAVGGDAAEGGVHVDETGGASDAVTPAASTAPVADPAAVAPAAVEGGPGPAR